MYKTGIVHMFVKWFVEQGLSHCGCGSVHSQGKRLLVWLHSSVSSNKSQQHHMQCQTDSGRSDTACKAQRKNKY